MIKIKNKFLITSILIFSLFGVSACNKPPFMKKMQGGVPVESIVLKTSPVIQSGLYQAKLISRHSVSLRPQVSGHLFNIYIKPGDHVKAGKVLMLIDKRKQEAALNSSKADAEVAKATLNSYKVQRNALESSLFLNKSLYERYKALYEKKSVSKQDLEKYTDSYNKAKADLDANTAQIEAQKAIFNKTLFSIKEQEVELEYYNIVAPYSGIIGDIPVKYGDYVTTSSQLLNITQNNPLEINVGLPIE
jgi:RND family efflux transporter MFP subunit